MLEWEKRSCLYLWMIALIIYKENSREPADICYRIGEYSVSSLDSVLKKINSISMKIIRQCNLNYSLSRDP